MVDYGPNAVRRQHVREARENAGLTRADLAAASYVPEAALAKIEVDGWRPPDSMRAAIAATLGKPEADLFTEELVDAMPPEPSPTAAPKPPALGAAEAKQRLLRLRGVLRFARGAS